MARIPIESSTARTARIGGRELVFFGGCNYLALAHHPEVLAAAREGLDRHGLSTAASRETTGNSVAHDALERELAQFLGVESVVLMPDGATANLAAFEALARGNRSALVDAQGHPSLCDAARAAGMQLAEFPAGDVARARTLGRDRARDGVVIASDGVFPSAGRAADVHGLLAALDWSRGALLIDDCHGLGVLGARGRGVLELAGVADERIVVTATLSKALGCSGGFVAGTAAIEHELRSTRTYVGTTPIPPALAEAGRASLAVLRREPERVALLAARVAELRSAFRTLGLPVRDLAFPLFAFQFEDSARMRWLHDTLAAEGLYVPLVSYFGDKPGGTFRVALNAAHTSADVQQLAAALGRHVGGMR